MKTRPPHTQAKGRTKVLKKPIHDNNSKKSGSVLVEDRSAKELAEHALLFYNEAARLTRSQEYQFVKDKSYNCYRADGASTTAWYHLNFIARSTLGTEESTFFAEVRENETQLLVSMCQIVAVRSGEEIPCLAGCKICDKDDCRDTLIHPITGITKAFETETSSIQEDQHDMSSFVWSKPLPTSSMKLKPIPDRKSALFRSMDVKYWTPEEYAKIALDFYNEAARLSKAPQYQYVKLTSYCRLFTSRCTKWHHLNFIARPASQAQEFTFFAEIREYSVRLSIMRCQIVEDTPSLGGCEICDDYKDRELIHPITGVYKGY